MATVQDWLTATRIHTASLTIPGTLLGLAAAGSRDAVQYVLVGVFALVFHAVGFLHNNLCDLEHDRRDPSKAHFPLVTGAIPEDAACAVWKCGMVAVFAYGMILITAYATAVLVAAAFLFFAVVAGNVYNLMSKCSLAAPLWISLSFASLPAFAFIVGGGTTPTLTILYVFAYAVFLMLPQIAVSGYVKDLHNDPVSLMRRLGARATPIPNGGDLYDYRFSERSAVFGLGLRLPCFLLSGFYAVTHDAGTLALGIVLFAGTGSLFAFGVMLTNGASSRSTKVRLMSISEVCTYFALIASLEHVLGAWTWALYAAPFAWFLTLNKVLWGAWSLAPKV